MAWVYFAIGFACLGLTALRGFDAYMALIGRASGYTAFEAGWQAAACFVVAAVAVGRGVVLMRRRTPQARGFPVEPIDGRERTR